MKELARTRVVRLVVALCAAAGPLALSGPAHAGRPTTMNAAQLECIGIVVDPAGSGSARAPDTFCATVPYGATGEQVLAARAKALNRPQPRYQGGLLCAIDGYPATGCGDRDTDRGGYDYWSYWHKKRGTSQWSYSGTGADQYSPVPGDLEGWAFQQGGGEGGRVPPAVSAESVCATARPAASTPTATSKTTPATRKPSPTKAPSRTPTTAGPTSAATRNGAPSATRSVRVAALGAAVTPTTPAPTVTHASPSSVAPITATAPAPSGAAVISPAVADPPAPTKGGGAPVGLIVAGVAVLVLGTGALARGRATRR